MRQMVDRGNIKIRSMNASVVPLKLVATAQLVVMLFSFPVFGFISNFFLANELNMRSFSSQNHMTLHVNAAPDNKSRVVWVPPTQNAHQRRGNIFSVRDPGDLLHFISEEERLCVGKFFLVI